MNPNHTRIEDKIPAYAFMCVCLFIAACVVIYLELVSKTHSDTKGNSKVFGLDSLRVHDHCNDLRSIAQAFLLRSRTRRHYSSLTSSHRWELHLLHVQRLHERRSLLQCLPSHRLAWDSPRNQVSAARRK